MSRPDSSGLETIFRGIVAWRWGLVAAYALLLPPGILLALRVETDNSISRLVVQTDSDFQDNLDYLPHSPLSHLHVFPYSDRPGTAASAMRGKVNGTTVRERGVELRRIGAELTRRFHQSQCGTTRPGLTLEDGTLVVTDNYLKVRIPAGLPRNQRVRVRLTSVGSALVGELAT